jgi:hypothetical protein
MTRSSRLISVVFVGLGSAWVGAHVMAIYVVPRALRRVVPFPYDLHTQHLMMFTVDSMAIVVGLLLAVGTLGGATGPLRARMAWVSLGASLGLAIAAGLQRQWIQPHLGNAIVSRRISYPIAPPVPEFDELMFRSTLLDATMLVCGLVVIGVAARRLVAPRPDSP